MYFNYVIFAKNYDKKMNKTSIFIADNYYLIREGLKRSLKTLKEVNIVGESNDLSDVVPQVALLKPDILIMEINLCKQPIATLLQELKGVSAQTKVLVISDCSCITPVLSCLSTGVAGFVPKDVDKTELIKAITEIAAGKEYLSSEISRILVKSLTNKPEHKLSERELEILKHICKGKSNEQIAENLFLSEMTVATHKRNIMRKTAVKKTTELILWAMQHQIAV